MSLEEIPFRHLSNCPGVRLPIKLWREKSAFFLSTICFEENSLHSWTLSREEVRGLTCYCNNDKVNSKICRAAQLKG